MLEEDFIHDLTNKVGLIDMCLTRIEATVTEEQKVYFERMQRASRDANDLIKQYKEALKSLD